MISSSSGGHPDATLPSKQSAVRIEPVADVTDAFFIYSAIEDDIPELDRPFKIKMAICGSISATEATVD